MAQVSNLVGTIYCSENITAIRLAIFCFQFYSCFTELLEGKTKAIIVAKVVIKLHMLPKRRLAQFHF